MLDGKYIKRKFDFSDMTPLSETKGNTVEGHAAVYNQVINIGGMFDEVIQSGAFDRTDLSDVAFYLNHEIDNLPMARCRKSFPNSTMNVTPDADGLFMTAVLDVDNNLDAKSLISSINRMDISGMSFAFIVGAETWEGLDTETPMRTIESIAKVIEVSAVTYPAYDNTDIGARSNSLESDRSALERAKSAVDTNELDVLKLKIKMKAGL